MGWGYRYVPSGSVYEIGLRAREGIPFPCRSEVNFLVENALAWALRDNPVKLCHIVVMGNHIHMMVIAYDPTAFVNFYGEFAKRLTDSTKRLLGLRHLSLWGERPMVALIADSEACLKRIEYFYLNPARANLSQSISQYPGVSSFEAFRSASASVDAKVEKSHPCLLMPDIDKARGVAAERFITAVKDASILRPPRSVTYHPFAWLKVFKGHTLTAEGARDLILSRISKEEEMLAQRRVQLGIKLFSRKELTTQKVLAPHTPKKYDRRVFVISSIKELRIEIINKVLRFTEKCRELYRKWKLGYPPEDWPLGMFKPNPPMVASLLG